MTRWTTRRSGVLGGRGGLDRKGNLIRFLGKERLDLLFSSLALYRMACTLIVLATTLLNTI